MAIRGILQTPNLLSEASPSIQQIKRIYRKPEETTTVDDFIRFSEANPEPKGVKYLNHGSPRLFTDYFPFTFKRLSCS